jgi:hypothetical protein
VALIFGNSMATGKYVKGSNEPLGDALELKFLRRKAIMFLLPH